ncbi:UbiA prenyltransferase family-domain-containing protein [Podospora aff. communis PSN243]|uniref:Diterpenoid pyrone biosynthesis cluster protein C n=1 Tax=Podospora aff. communis PSN243 TaxID=3040156 RepID=A0AAV9GEY4_9PEZI|nr:UbiA prenyltransferase family-domain-containing protein [Podospora aff. communis PSN243]
MSAPNPPSEKTSLAQQYGGRHSGTWVDRLPRSWIPYVQLARLSPPAGLFLIFFPHLFGALHASLSVPQPLHSLAQTLPLLLLGSLFFSNAAHTYNDLIDAPLDALVSRTKTRPIPRGAVTPTAAFLFATSQALLAALCLVFLPKDTSLAALATVVATFYYPYAKRHTHFVQFILGFCLAWGVVVGAAAVGAAKPWEDRGTLCLVGAVGCWVVVFDTIYAHQDLTDDVRVGVKSMAVLVNKGGGRWARGFLVTMGLLMGLLMVGCGWSGGMGVVYYAVAVGGSVVSVGMMVLKVELEDHGSCWVWFSKGFWVTGTAIAVGFLGEHRARIGELSLGIL